jgi:hypothetical protein
MGVRVNFTEPPRDTGVTLAPRATFRLFPEVNGLFPWKTGMVKLWLMPTWASGMEDTVTLISVDDSTSAQRGIKADTTLTASTNRDLLIMVHSYTLFYKKVETNTTVYDTIFRGILT